MKKLFFLLSMMAIFCALCISSAVKPAGMFFLPPEWLGNFDGKPMALDDIRELAAKGNSLLFEDLRPYKGLNVSSSFSRCIILYGVECGYRLTVHSNPTGRPDSVNLESVWEAGGTGIDIRYGDVDAFIQAHPSHPALTADEMKTITQSYTTRKVTVVDLDWWDYADESPHHCQDPAKQALREALDAVDEPLELFMDEDGMLIAVSRKTGAVYICEAEAGEPPVWILCRK